MINKRNKKFYTKLMLAVCVLMMRQFKWRKMICLLVVSVRQEWGNIMVMKDF